MIKAFNHTSFTVANLDRALEFWTKGLGFQAATVAERRGDWQASVTGVKEAKIRVAHLFAYGHHMELIQYLNPSLDSLALQPNYPGVGHICLEVTDIDNTVALLLSLGGRPQGQVADVNEGPVKGCRAVYIRDPEGIIIEFLEIGEPASDG